MQIILMEKVVNLGGLGDVVKVKDGYARNFLIPQGKAKRATEANRKIFEEKRAELERAQAEAIAAAQGSEAVAICGTDPKIIAGKFPGFWPPTFPAVIGRICHHPCESACNRAGHDEALAICKLERCVGDIAIASGGVAPAAGGFRTPAELA